MTAPSLACLMNQLETLWGYYDSVLATLTPTDWQQPFGSEWTVADVPRHLIYFDRQVLAEPIAAGPNVPAERQVLMRTHREFNLWNSQSLAVQRRQSGLPHLLSELQAARAAVRAAVAPLTEADLDRPVWIALTGVGGWRTVRFALEIGRQHAWMHLMQLRLRLGPSVPAVCPEITHDALNGILWALVNLPKRRWAGPRRLTVAMEIVGPGGRHVGAARRGWPMHPGRRPTGHAARFDAKAKHGNAGQATFTHASPAVGRVNGRPACARLAALAQILSTICASAC